jgi:alpha-beta hydrolase superfamily lysophospholipase
VHPGRRGAHDDHRERPPLTVIFSQDPMRRRTRFERMLARSQRPLLVLLIAAIAAAAFCVIAAIRYTEAALHPPRRPYAADAAKRAADLAGRHDATVTPAALLAVDGAVLRGWWFRPRRDSTSSALLLHGFGDNREAMLPLVELLLDRGVRVLVPDLRAHGSSGGGAVTWGALEARDTASWVEWIEQKHPDECVVAFGASLGGGIVLQSLGRTPLCAAAAEAPFASFASKASYDLLRWTGLPPRVGDVLGAPVVRLAMLYAKLRTGVDLQTADALPALARSHTPVLLIENAADRIVRQGTIERLADANPRMTTTWRVPGAAHAAAWREAPGEFPARVVGFLARHR